MKRQAVLESLILTIRNQKVLLDADLATIYGVETRVINQAVKRNADRFPEDFRFQLTREEAAALFDSRSQFVTLKRGQNIKYQPYAFTEHAAIMAATVLNSPEAVKMSVFVVRAFVQMREQLAANSAILKRLAEIDKTLLEHDPALGLAAHSATAHAATRPAQTTHWLSPLSIVGRVGRVRAFPNLADTANATPWRARLLTRPAQRFPDWPTRPSPCRLPAPRPFTAPPAGPWPTASAVTDSIKDPGCCRPG